MKERSRSATVLIIERDPVRRLGLVSLLNDNNDVEVAGAGSDLLNALSSMPSPNERIEILVINVDSAKAREANYWATIHLILSPEVRIVALCRNTDECQLEILAAAGVTALHWADTEPGRLSRAISNAACGQVDYDTELLDQLRRAMLVPVKESDQSNRDVEFEPQSRTIFIRGRHIRITPRELEVAELVSNGLTNRQIACELGISERTVGFHVSNLLRKLGLSSRIEVIHLVRQIERRYSEQRFPVGTNDL